MYEYYRCPATGGVAVITASVSNKMTSGFEIRRPVDRGMAHITFFIGQDMVSRFTYSQDVIMAVGTTANNCTMVYPGY